MPRQGPFNPRTDRPPLGNVSQVSNRPKPKHERSSNIREIMLSILEEGKHNVLAALSSALLDCNASGSSQTVITQNLYVFPWDALDDRNVSVSDVMSVFYVQPEGKWTLEWKVIKYNGAFYGSMKNGWMLPACWLYASLQNLVDVHLMPLENGMNHVGC